MARSFSASSSNTLLYSAATVTPSYPFSMSAWFKPTGVHAGSTFYGFGNTVTAAWAVLAYDGSNRVFCEFQIVGTVSDALGPAGTLVVDNSWNLIVWVNNSATSHIAYCNNVAGPTETSNIATIPSFNRYGIGGGWFGSATPGGLCRGDVGFCTYWQGVALSAGDVTSLWNGGAGGLGKHPLNHAQSASVADFYEVAGTANPEPDEGNDGTVRDMTVNGSCPQATGPPVESLFTVDNTTKPATLGEWDSHLRSDAWF